MNVRKNTDLTKVKIKDIYPSFWDTSMDKIDDIYKSDADFFRIRSFGDIHIYSSSKGIEEEYLYDLYLSQDPICSGLQSYYRFSMTEFRKIRHIDVNENLDDPGFYFDKDSLESCIYETFKLYKKRANDELVPFQGNCVIEAQTTNDHYYYGETSLQLFFSYLHIYPYPI